jgi:hypothetical protein
MRRRLLSLLVLTLGLLTAAPRTAADDDDKPPEFPKVKSFIPGPFHVLNVTGPRAGRYHSLVCRYGLNPVLAVFVRPPAADKLDDWARELEEGQPLATLIKKIDDVKVHNPDAVIGSFVVYTAATEKEEEPLRVRLKALPEALGLENMVQTIADEERQKGLEGWKAVPALAKDGPEGEVSVVLIHQHRVVNVWNFNADRPLEAKDADAVAAALDKLIPANQRPGQKAQLKIKPKAPAEPKEPIAKEPKEKEPKEEPKEKPKDKEPKEEPKEKDDKDK